MNEKIKKAKESLGKLIEDISIDSGYSYPALYADIRTALNQVEEEVEEAKQQNKILKEELNAVDGFRTHYKSFQEKLANNLKTINCMQEEETTNRNLIDSLEDRNDRLVERLEKQKAKLKELKKDNHSLTKTIAQLTEADYYFITSMALDMLKGNSNFALMYVDDIFCLVDTKSNSFDIIDEYDIDTENIGKSKCQELNDLREFAKVLCKMKIVDSNHKIYGINENDIALIKKVVEKRGIEK